jgi:hypothetical protein
MPPYSTDTILKYHQGSASVVHGTAGTTALIASFSTGRIYVTDIIVGNLTSAVGWTFFGYGPCPTAAPTGDAILINRIISTATSNYNIDFLTPIIIPANNCFLVTTVSITTCSITAVYYVAP